MENLTDLDLLCLYAVMGGATGKQVIEYVKREQEDKEYSEKAIGILQELQRSAESYGWYDLTDVAYMKIRLELVQRGLLDGDVKEIEGFIKAWEDSEN